MSGIARGRARATLLVGGGVALLAGCARPDAAGLDDGLGTDYLPLRPGAEWTYRVSDGTGRSADKVARVESRDFPGPRSAGAVFRVRFSLLDGSVLSWERRTRAGVGCLQEETRDATGAVTMEEAYDPPETVVDARPERLVAGAHWNETFTEITPNYRGHPKATLGVVKWTVESTDDRVTVPAGTFACLRVRRARKHHGASTFWFAKGVGLVKEVGAGPLGDQTLALVRAAPIGK
jgi:hypothetical protein